jgi:hypothetical protein
VRNVVSRWSRAALVFAAVVAADATWVFYIRAIGGHRHLEAAVIAVILLLVGAYATVSYVEDRKMIWPAAAGGFVGTYLTSAWLS